MRVYLDTCCLNRLLDRSVEPRVRAEAQAVARILAMVEAGALVMLSSDILDFEITRTPASSVRTRAQVLAGFAGEIIKLNVGIERRATELAVLGLRLLDALHVASAEAGHADVFLTTDDRLIRAAARSSDQINMPVVNPAVWLAEETH